MIGKNKLIPHLKQTQLDSFLSKVDRSGGIDSCWNWTGSRKAIDSYGKFPLGKKFYIASRLAYYICYKKDPADWLVCHKCDNPLCVNPNHLFLGTHSDNMHDMKMKGRAPRQPRKTHCIRGHALTPENTRVQGNKHSCKKCHYIRSKARLSASN